MKTHLFKSKDQLFLSASIKNVVSHINATSPAGSLQTVTQLDDDTLVRLDGRLFDLHELTRYYQNKAKNDGFTFDETLSVIVRGKIVKSLTDKTRTLTNILIDRIAEGQSLIAYDDYAHDYTKRQFIKAIHRVKEKMDIKVERQDKKYYLKLALAYRIQPEKSPQHHQNITNWQPLAKWAIANAVAQT